MAGCALRAGTRMDRAAWLVRRVGARTARASHRRRRCRQDDRARRPGACARRRIAGGRQDRAGAGFLCRTRLGIVRAAAPGFIETRLSGFRDADIEAYTNKVNPAHANLFIAALKANGVPRALTANPLTFAMLARVWRADQPLPNRRTTLFDAYTALVLQGNFETAKTL